MVAKSKSATVQYRWKESISQENRHANKRYSSTSSTKAVTFLPLPKDERNFTDPNSNPHHESQDVL